MDDNLQILIYIIFFAIYLLSRVFRNKNKQAPRPSREMESDEPATTDAPPLTFEDILRELTTGEKPRQTVRRQTPQPPKPEPARREYEFKSDYPDDDEIEEVFQDSVKKAQNIKTLDEMVELKEPVLKFKEYDVKEEGHQSSLASEIRNMLMNPDDARKAIILKEILDRKF